MHYAQAMDWGTSYAARTCRLDRGLLEKSWPNDNTLNHWSVILWRSACTSPYLVSGIEEITVRNMHWQDCCWWTTTICLGVPYRRVMRVIRHYTDHLCAPFQRFTATMAIPFLLASTTIPKLDARNFQGFLIALNMNVRGQGGDNFQIIMRAGSYGIVSPG